MAREITGRLLGKEGIVCMQSPTSVSTNNAERLGRYSSVRDHRSSLLYLEQNLFNKWHKDTIACRKIEGGTVNTIHQLEPWGPGAVMITAISDNIKNELVEGRVPVKFVYEFPDAVQIEYHKHLLAGLHTSAEIKLPGENPPNGKEPKVVAMENAVRKLTGDRLYGRSMPPPHTVLVKTGFPADATDPSRHSFAEQLLLSQKTLHRMPIDQANNALFEIETNIKSFLGKAGDSLEFFERRSDPPYGYTIVTPIEKINPYKPNIKRLDQDATLLTQIMHANFFANASVSDKYIQEACERNDRFKLWFNKYGLEGYANRHYYYFASHPETGRDTLHITIAPTPLGGAALENAGWILHRREDFAPLFKEETIKEFRGSYRKEFTTLVPQAQ